MSPETQNESDKTAPKPPVDILAKPEPRTGKKVSRTLLWILALSFMMGLIAVLGALYLDKSFERKIDKLDVRVDEMRREIQDGIRPSLRSLTERQDSQDVIGKQLNERVSKMDEQVGLATTAQGQLSSIIQGGRRIWILYEVEYLLLNANDRLALEDDVGGAVRALDAASQRLAVAADPQLLPVRRRIAQELAELRAIPQPDVEEIALTLSALASSVPNMPLESRVPEKFTPTEEPSPAQPAGSRWDRFVQMMTRALRGLAVIRRENKPLEPMLPPGQAFFLYQNLQLKLENARLSALHRDTAGFRASVATAREWLQAYFMTGDPQVAAAIKQLSTFEREQLSWTLPDITGSLVLLRREMEARGIKPAGTEPVPTPSPEEEAGPQAPAP